MVFNFIDKKYTIKSKKSWRRVFTEYETEIFKKDLKKEISQKMTKEIEIKELPPKIFNPVILWMAIFAIVLFCITLTVSR